MQAAQAGRHTAAAVELREYTPLRPRCRHLPSDPARAEEFSDDTVDRPRP